MQTQRFSSIEDIGLGLTGEALLEAFTPFICKDASFADRLKLVLKQRRATLKRAFSGEKETDGRQAEKIKAEYQVAWSRGYEAYDLARGCRKPEPWHFRGKRMILDRAGVARMRSIMLAAVIRQIKPRRVLEVGCGNGINLLQLAGAFPEVSFSGLELTDAGHQVATGLQKAGALPEALAGYAPEAQKDPTAFQRINFVQGNAGQLPFEAKSFDLVFTVLALEQMESLRQQALAEIARVSSRYFLGLEPFAEANASFWLRLHVNARGYFKGAVAELPAHGFEPVWASMDYPQELQLGSAFVLSKVR